MPGIAPYIQDVTDAIESGDPSVMKAMVPLIKGTGIAPKLDAAIADAESKIAPAQKIADQVNGAGGIESKTGRMKLADSVNDYSSEFGATQPQTNFLYGLGQLLMHNPNAYKAISKGVVTQHTQVGTNGDSVTVWLPENSDRPEKVWNNSEQRWMSPKEYADGGYGLYSNMESTPGYKARIEQTKKAAESYWPDLEAANRATALYDNISGSNKVVSANAMQLAASGLSSPEINNLFAASNVVNSTKSSLSSGFQKMKQNNDTTSFNNAIKNARENGLDIGIPATLKYSTGKNFVDDQGKSWSINDLESQLENFNGSSGTEQNISKSADFIRKSAVYQKLDYKQKVMFDNMMNAIHSIEQLKTDNKDTIARVPVIARTIPYEMGQAMPVALSNIVVDDTNSKAIKLYRDRLYEAGKNGGLPDPGAIAASMSVGSNKAQLDEWRNNAAKAIDSIQSSAVEPQSFVAPATAQPVAPKLPAMPKPAANNRANPAAQEIATRSELPKGIPKGSELVPNKFAKGGKAVYKAPDGSLHTPD